MDTFNLGDFTLRSGVTLPNASLAYTTFGTLNAARSNAILFPNFLGGAPEALETWIGEGRPLDPAEYFIILPGHFGLLPSSSPSNTPAPFDRGAFPAVHIADDVIAQRRLLSEQFGIDQLELVLGWSVGALQTYEWAVRYPEVVKRVASIAGAPQPSPWTRLWLRSVLEEPLTGDAAYHGGFYPDAQSMQAGVRRMAHGTAVTLPPLGFYREGEEAWKGLGFSSMEDFIIRFWEAFWLPHDPNDIIAQARKARAADPSGGGDLTEALGSIKARTVVVAFTGDPMFPPAECARDAERIPGALYREVVSNFGHLATFALSEADVKTVDGILRDLLAT
ncbi:alpha/beta fold hydrolase [Actinoplanes sp. KI2]|uniref:alpha/beta fold hydrolase n=1 Tax=Actinoplanes sp. KI2 TaxID=2983315 RepID=UPI0021D5A99B|nr:alpha/beta fold hydrolase [Actinoplanes sp. KI2]MCU7729556.1 alpha/beta fold hydrolase [Actinoplanes sp. KI2]